MTKSFVPLSASAFANAPAGGASPTKAPSDPKLAEAFRPITAAGLGPRATPPAAGEPKVTLVKNGDRVTSIKVQCVCGHTIELACE